MRTYLNLGTLGPGILYLMVPFLINKGIYISSYITEDKECISKKLLNKFQLFKLVSFLEITHDFYYAKTQLYKS